MRDEEFLLVTLTLCSINHHDLFLYVLSLEKLEWRLSWATLDQEEGNSAQKRICLT